MSIDRVDTSKCAICGTQRQEANHWFLVSVAGGWQKPADDPRGESRKSFAWRGMLQVTEWREDLARTEGWRSVCGEGDLFKLVSRWISNGTLDDPKNPAADAARKEA